ncbi:MAG: hypothetical protein ABTQ73_03765 [Caldilineales bacterium]
MATSTVATKWRRGNFLFPSLLVLVLVLLVGAVAVLPYALNLESHAMGRNFDLSSALLGIWLLLIILLWSLITGRFDPFEMPTWISINTYFQVIVNVWLLQRDFKPMAPWLQQHYATTSVQANLLFAVCLTVMWLAYVLRYQRLKKRQHQAVVQHSPMRVQMVVVIWVVTWTLSAVAVAMGIQGYLSVRADWRWQNYYNFMLLVNNATTGLLMIQHFRRPTRLGRIWLVALMTWNVGSSLVIGTKGAILTFIWLTMSYYYATRKFPWRWLLVGAVVAMLIIPSINLIRVSLHSVDAGGGVALSDRLKIVSNATGQIATRSWSDLYDESRDTFEERQSGILTITQSIVYLHPTYLPYLAKETIEYTAIQLIPRLVWPDKPAERGDLFMTSTQYLGLSNEYSFSDIGLFGDSYRIGGWFAVALIFSTLGVFGAELYRRGPGVDQLQIIILYMVIVNDIVRYPDPVSLMFMRILQMGGLLWLLLHFVLFDNSRKPLTSLQLREKQQAESILAELTP